MKFLHVLFGFVLFAALMAGGGLLVYAAAYPAVWTRVFDLARPERLLGMGAGIAVLLLTAIYLLSGVRRKPSEQYLSFDNEGGSVSISMKAVRDFLSREAADFAAVLSLSPSIVAVGGGVEVELNVKVRSGTQIPELCRMLQDRVREKILNNLGVSDIKSIKVNVQEIVTAQPQRKPEKEESSS